MRIYYIKKGTDTAEDITSLVVSFKSSYSFQENRLLGNAPSLMLDIDLNNADGTLTGCAEGTFYIDTNQIDGSDIPAQEFLVQEAPEKYTSKISLTLYDKMIKFNQPYKSAFSYKSGEYPTISQQLDEMENLSGISIDKSNLSQLVLNSKAEWIDTTIVMRNYLGWIAELDGKNALIDRANRIVFRSLLTDNHDIEYASDFDKTDLITISRVAYDDGVNLIVSGNDTGKTLYIDQSNSYCNNQAYTDAILALYDGQSFYGLSGLKTLGKDGVWLGDTVTYDGLKCIVLSIKRDYAGQESAFELDGEVALKNADSVVTKVSDRVRIKRLQVLADQAENKLSIISKDLENSKARIAELKVSSGAVEAKVSKLAGETEDTRTELKTFQGQTAEKFNQTVSKKEYDGAISEIQKNFDEKGIHVKRKINGQETKKEALLNDDELRFTRKDGTDAVRINGHETYFGKYVTYGSHRFEAFYGLEWDDEFVGGINENNRIVGTGTFLTRNEGK